MEGKCLWKVVIGGYCFLRIGNFLIRTYVFIINFRYAVTIQFVLHFQRSIPGDPGDQTLAASPSIFAYGDVNSSLIRYLLIIKIRLYDQAIYPIIIRLVFHGKY